MVLLEVLQIGGSNLLKQSHLVCFHQWLQFEPSVLRPLLFLIFTNDLNFVKNFTTLHFADDISLINVKESIKEINKSVNKDLKSLLHSLNANKNSPNVTKTEIVILRARGKVFDTDLK